MAYQISVAQDHVYVKYTFDVDSLDIIRITADPDFIQPLRKLNAVVHDFSFARSVNIGMNEIREISVLSNVESNFTEHLTGVVVPFDVSSTERVEALAALIKNQEWNIHIAETYEHAKILVAK